MTKFIYIFLVVTALLAFQNCGHYSSNPTVSNLNNKDGVSALRVSMTPIIGSASCAITLSANAVSDTAIAGVQFSIDGQPLGQRIAMAPYTALWNTSTLPNGTHTISVTAVDSNGNAGTSSQTVTVNNRPVVTPVITGIYPKRTVSLTPLSIGGSGFDAKRNVVHIEGPSFTKNFVLPGVAGGKLLTFTLPAAARTGTYTVTVTNSQFKSAPASFQVVTAPAPLPTPSAASALSTLRITPNPCKLDATGKCQVAVSWNTHSSVVTLWASKNGAAPVLVACGSHQKSVPVPWIVGGNLYEFSIYQVDSCEGLNTSSPDGDWLASVSTTGIPLGALQYPPANIGMVHIELAEQYQGRNGTGALGTDAEAAVETLMARKAMIDAKTLYGANTVRFSPIGFWPQDLVLWLVDPPAYWSMMDRLMHDLSAHGYSAELYFNWNSKVIPTFLHETEADMYGNPNSASYKMFASYIREFVTRYSKDPKASIALYSVGGEMSNGTNLIGRCDDPGWLCAASGNFSTNQLIAFQTRIATLIRTIDPSRPIASGNSLTRSSAFHLEVKPAWVTGGPDWGLDTKTQFEWYLTYISQGLDLIEVHLYNAPRGTVGANQAIRFCPGPDCTGDRNSAGILNVVNAVAQDTGKKVYIAEYGDFYHFLNYYLPGFGPFIRDVLDRTASLSIPYTSPWSFEDYDSRTSTYKVQPTYQNIEPGYSDSLISYIREKNLELGSIPVPPQVSIPTAESVLTNPLDGSTLTSASTLLYVVASAPHVGVSIASVQFTVDGKTVASVAKPPYQYDLPNASLSAGMHTIAAIAKDSLGRQMTSNAATVSCTAAVCIKK